MWRKPCRTQGIFSRPRRHLSSGDEAVEECLVYFFGVCTECRRVDIVKIGCWPNYGHNLSRVECTDIIPYNLVKCFVRRTIFLVVDHDQRRQKVSRIVWLDRLPGNCYVRSFSFLSTRAASMPPPDDKIWDFYIPSTWAKGGRGCF